MRLEETTRYPKYQESVWGFQANLDQLFLSVGLSSQQFLLTWFESYFMSLLTSGVATKFPANQMYTLQL